jgi:acetylornithine/succinyldiaminopimelate/putrescine aminotransferase
MPESHNLPAKPAGAAMTRREKAELEARFGRHINEGQVKYLKAGHLDVIETQRSGIRFVDPVQNRPFIDCFGSAGCFNVGRRNPEVMATLVAALDEYDMGSFHMVSAPKARLAKKLVELAPAGVDRVLFAAGGGDAVDAAIKLARGATGRSEIISTVKGYHGHTGFALGANGKAHYREYCEPLIPDFRFAPFNDLKAMEAMASPRTAAIIIEPVQGEAGIFVGDDDYLRGLRALCDRCGALLIFDEIQTGFGRTGRFFACEHSGVSPDIMTIAKSLGGGLYPNAAVLYRGSKTLAGYVDKNPDFHPSPAGGADLACLVSLKAIELIEKNRLCANAEAMGARLKGALRELLEQNPKIIKEVRGRGLMIGIEYIHEFMGPMMSDALAKNGMFAAYSGNAPQVMRFMLPLTVTDEEMDTVIAAIRGAVASMKMLLPFALPAAKIPAVLRALNNEKAQIVLFGFLRRVEDAVGVVGRAFKGGRS